MALQAVRWAADEARTMSRRLHQINMETRAETWTGLSNSDELLDFVYRHCLRIVQWRRWRKRNRSYLNVAAARRYRRRLHR